MPVIGRLDRQVEDLIISPISERRREQDPPAADGETADALRETPAPATSQTPPAGESSADRRELPVWLL